MLTLYHAPRSRSTRIVWLLEELGVPYHLHHVSIRYRDGSGDGPDFANPHPDKKVPALLHDDALVTESAAVALYLSDLVPEARLAPAIGTPARGAFLTWLSWIEGEFGPVIFGKMANPSHTTAFDAAVRRLTDALAQGPYLLGEHFSAADVMMGGTIGWAQGLLPRDAAVDAYVERLTTRPAFGRGMAKDAAPVERADARLAPHLATV